LSDPDTIATLLWWLLGGVVFPTWLLCGFADYACHARTDITHTSGVHESALHLLQTAEIGVPMLAFLFLEVNASVLLLMFSHFRHQCCAPLRGAGACLTDYSRVDDGHRVCLVAFLTRPHISSTSMG